MITALNTADEARAAIAAVIAANPDKINPMVHHVCRFTSTTDPDWHCIVGQLAADLGWSVPGPKFDGGSVSATEVYGWPVSDEALEVLMEAQKQADHLTSLGEPWGEIDLSRI